MVVKSLLRLFLDPVRPETTENLSKIWSGLKPEFRTENQMLGRHEEGCGATIGVMPRCDFACQCCYLGNEANRIPEIPIESVKGQLRTLRKRLGAWGNLQLTDGEVTLRKKEELIEILRYAHEIELIPMIMTHGDSFRRQPGLLEELVLEGGLSEISLHIDITQRGRLGCDYKKAKGEIELMPLREEFATMIRDVRKRTKKVLRVASTITVVPGNISEIPQIVSWYQNNADVFRLISFQPIASVGRTDSQIECVIRENVWDKISQGLNFPKETSSLPKHQWWIGHPECSRFVMGFISRKMNSKPLFFPLSISGGDKSDRHILSYFYQKWGGITFRADKRVEKISRILGMFKQAPLFFLIRLPWYISIWLKRFDRNRPLTIPFQILRKRLDIHRFTVVTHHFMNANEVQSALGQERIQQCAFVVPINGELKSMCEVNAMGIRNRFYQNIRNSKHSKGGVLTHEKN